MRPVTELAQWKRAHAQPAAYMCRWSEALESITKTNVDMAVRLYFIWPRVILRTIFWT